MTASWVLASACAVLIVLILSTALWSSGPHKRTWGQQLTDLIRNYVRPPDPPDFDVRAGRFDALVRGRVGAVAHAAEIRTRDGMTYTASRPSGNSNDSSRKTAQAISSDTAHVSDVREALLVAAPSAVLTGTLVGDTLKSAVELDGSLLNAMTQMSGVQIDGLTDFRNFQALDGYQLDSYKLRGAIGEQESAEGFEGLGHDVSWPAGGATGFGPSNNPGWDLSVDGHPVNVKVVADASDAAADHFAKYPDIPLVVNSDAANIPDDAVYVDAENVLQPDDLIGDNIVIVQEALTLSGIEDIQVAGGDAAEPIDLEGAADVVPGIGLLIAGVRSGIREGRLLANGKTEAARAMKNVAIDTAVRGGGGVGGLIGGAKIGLAIDTAMGGAGLGIPTLVCGTGGAILGALAGGKAANAIKALPLKEAQEKLKITLQKFNAEVTRAQAEAATTFEERCARADARHVNTCRHIHDAYTDLLGELDTELRRSCSLSPDEARTILDAATVRVAAAEAEYCEVADRPGLRRRLSSRRSHAVSNAEAWRTAKASLERDAIELEKAAAVMDVVMAAPGGQRVADEFLDAFEARRQAIRETAFAGHSLMLDLARTSRQQAIRALEQLREELRTAAEGQIQPTAQLLDQAKQDVWRELEQAGQR